MYSATPAKKNVVLINQMNRFEATPAREKIGIDRCMEMHEKEQTRYAVRFNQ
jgi:hypothetical protein